MEKDSFKQDSFKLQHLPQPDSLRQLGEFEIIGRKYDNDEIPEYEPMQ